MSVNISGFFKKNPYYGIYLFLIICIYLLSFEEPITGAGFSLITLFRNTIPIAAVIYFLISSIHMPANFRKLLTPYFICGLIFAVSGIVGWLTNYYQNFFVTIQALYEHIRFWLCLYLFTELFRILPFKHYARRFFFHISILSATIILPSIADYIFEIWPRQIYRFGIGSIQIFYGHPSNLSAHAIFLIALLCILYPYIERDKFHRVRLSVVNIVLMVLLLVISAATLRLRIIGLIIFFIALYLFMIIFKKRLSLPVILIGTAGAAAIGGRRLYDFYFSPYAYTMARGQFAINSLDIASRYFPFGSGFGTFGSRMAQLHYSPLYYKYKMMATIGLSPEHPAYACDTFFPCILAESGWMGFIAYLAMIFLLIFSVLRKQKAACLSQPGRYACFTAVILIAFELLETTGSLAFSETYSVLIAFALGLCLVTIQSAGDNIESDPV